MTRRLFAALCFATPLAEPFRGVLAELQHYPHLKVVPPENFHITLAFIGSCEERRAQGIVSDFQELRPPGKRIDVRLQGLGAFPCIERATVVWCGIKADRAALTGIQAVLQGYAGAWGFERDTRAFVPHLTLARARRPEPSLSAFLAEQAGTLYAESWFDRVVLFESHLSPRGARYSALCTLLLD